MDASLASWKGTIWIEDVATVGRTASQPDKPNCVEIASAARTTLLCPTDQDAGELDSCLARLETLIASKPSPSLLSKGRTAETEGSSSEE